MKKTLTALILALALLTGSAAAFSDVDEGLYYAAPIAWAVERGITTGTSDDTFSPDALCTRGQIITFLWRAAGTPDPQSMDSAYGDVTPDMNQDIYKAILWAGEAGIIGPENLDDDRFIPSAPCGRSDAVLFLWRYSGSPESGAPADFTDVFPDADYAQAVAWAVENGITSGTSESTFSPSEPCTRGQITTFLYRCVNEAAPGEKTPEDPAPPAQKPAESTRPTRTYTGAGTARSLGLDGSAFTQDGVYDAEATVDVYSPHEAVFTVKVPYPLYQACAYTVRFQDPEDPAKVYRFTCLRQDEAFSDILPWQGDPLQFQSSGASGELSGFTAALQEARRTDGVLSWRVVFTNGPGSFRFDLLDGFQLSCQVDSNQTPASK